MKAAHSSLFLINPPKNYYSKQLTKYDTELTFDKKLKHFLRIHKNYKFIISFLKERIKKLYKKFGGNNNWSYICNRFSRQGDGGTESCS